MDVLINLIVVIISQYVCLCVCVYIYIYIYIYIKQIIMLYTLNIFDFICQLHLNKAGGK